MKKRDTFEGTAAYYAQYRPGYPDSLTALLSTEFHLDGTGRLLDLGCGTGHLALQLAACFQSVVGMDPEPEMLTQAARQAQLHGIENVVWVLGSSEGLVPDLGSFRLVTMGRSFHWMDREATLRALFGMVVEGGGIAILDDFTCDTSTNDWRKEVDGVVRRWLGERRRAGSSIYQHPKERHELVVARSLFSRTSVHQLCYERRWTIDAVVGLCYSMSGSSRPVLGDKRAAFEADLRATLVKINASGEFREEVCLQCILAWKMDPAHSPTTR